MNNLPARYNLRNRGRRRPRPHGRHLAGNGPLPKPGAWSPAQASKRRRTRQYETAADRARRRFVEITSDIPDIPDCTWAEYTRKYARGELTPFQSTRWRRSMRRRTKLVPDAEIHALTKAFNGEELPEELADTACAELTFDQSRWLYAYLQQTGAAHRLIPQDQQSALATYVASAQAGHLDSVFAVGCHIARNGNEFLGIEVQKRAAQAGHLTAANNVGRALRKGYSGIPPNLPEAVKQYRYAARNRHVESMFAMAIRYFQGQGVLVDPWRGGKWMRRVFLYTGGEGTERSRQTLLRILEDRPHILMPMGRWKADKQSQIFLTDEMRERLFTVMLLFHRLRMSPYTALVTCSYVVTK
jgi:hypothetical protein